MSSDQVKSLLAGGFVMFLMLVVFRGTIVRHSYYGISGKYGVTYCHNVDSVPILRDIPCYALDLMVSILVIAILLSTVSLIMIITRKLSD